MTFKKISLLVCVTLAVGVTSCDTYRITEEEQKFSDSAKIVSESFLNYVDGEQYDSATRLLSDYYIRRHKEANMPVVLKKMREARGKSSSITLVGFEMRKMVGEQNTVYYGYEVVSDSMHPRVHYHFWFFPENKSPVRIDSVGVEVFNK